MDKQLIDPFEGILLLRKFVYHFAAAPNKLTSKSVAQHIVNKEVLDFFDVSQVPYFSLQEVSYLILKTYQYSPFVLKSIVSFEIILFPSFLKSLLSYYSIFCSLGADDLSFLTCTGEAGIHGEIHHPLRHTWIDRYVILKQVSRNLSSLFDHHYWLTCNVLRVQNALCSFTLFFTVLAHYIKFCPVWFSYHDFYFITFQSNAYFFFIRHLSAWRRR